MKILFIGDYSNLHSTLATELRRQGHTAHVVSDRCGYMNTNADFFLKREKGIRGAFRYLNDLFTLLPQLKDYDAVQLINANFLHLRPGKIKYFFDRLRNQNKALFLTLAGNDYYYCKACNEGKLFRFSEFKIGDRFTEFHNSTPQRLYEWMSQSNKNWSEYLYSKIDGAMAVLPEYMMAALPIIGKKLTFTNLPIDMASVPSPKYFEEYPVKIFIGMRSGMEVQKGTDKLLKLANEIATELPGKVTVEKVSDLPLHEYLKRMNESHIVLDQLYAYSPAMNALYAMAMGKVAASGAQKEYYDMIGNPTCKPIFNLSPMDFDVKERLMALINNPERIIRIGKQSHAHVNTYNRSELIASRFISAWEQSSK